MNSTRIISFTLCLGLACLLMMGSALAGKTEAVELEYAREVGGAGTQYVIPMANTIMRTLSILPSASFFIRVSLGGNAKFNGEEGGTLPVASDLIISSGRDTSEPAPTITLLETEGDTFAEYLVRLANVNVFDNFPVFTFETETWGIEDPDNVLGGGGTIDVTVTTRAANTGATIDAGTDSDAWLKGIAGVTVIKDSLKSTTATVDVATARTEFVEVNGDTLTMDMGATLGLSDMKAGALAANGTPYALVMGDTIELVVTGDLTGITEIVWNDDGDAMTTAGAGGEVRLAQSDEDFDLANGVATLTLRGNNDGIDRMMLDPDPGAAEDAMVGVVGTITIIVDGSTTLNSRTLNLAVNLDVVGDADDRDLVPTTNLTVWELNGTVFLANFVNGNNDMFHSRVYLFNHGPGSGDITVRVFTLPTSGASTLVGAANLGSLMSWSGRNIRVAEDVLMHMTALPYTADGGNLVLEITINANDIAGMAQVFQHDLSSFGIYELKTIN